MASWVSSAVSAIAGCAVSAVSALASSAASAVTERIVNMGFSYLGNHMLPADSETELERLLMALPQIREVMDIAEALKVKDPSSGAWFEQFRNAVEASEDVLDELEYKKLEDMVKNRDEAAGSVSCSKKRKTSLINDDTLRRLREAVRMLDLAAANVRHIHRRAEELGVHGLSELQQETGKALRRETTSFLTESEVFGRKVEKDKIIGWLKQPTNDHLSCFGIVGAGGLGKTTLAQFAYQEMNGSNHFDKIIWVCVSNNFSVENITRKVLDELGKSSCDDKPLNALQESLKEEVHSKKIFLVLDDIWDDDKRRDWEQLIPPLKFVQQGSKILFTTRMNSVVNLLASVINIESNSLALPGLPEKELLQLFNSYAFYGFNPDNHANLQEIGYQMVRMLKGSPLAAKVIGSLLNSRMDHLYWRRILDRGSLFELDQAKDVVEVLKLSYYHLPANLQVCFRFCSIFPQDYLFKKDELIKMWMASGFLQQQSCQEERLEDIGEDYFNHLLRKSFFENIHSYSYNNDDRYVMHDLMHELAKNVSKGECCRVEPNDKLVVVPSSVRHVSIHESEIERVSHLENLHSLVITISNSIDIGANPDPFVLPSKLIKKSLRLLKISAYRSYQLSEEISYLVHLRYLSINLCYFGTKSYKQLLPASIYKLYHLQVLEILDPYKFSYSGIESKRMTHLVRLRYMTLPQEIMKIIHGVHELTSLQELTFFVGPESGYCINELGTLNDLRNLSISNIENVQDPTEARSADLSGKENLMSLFLEWSSENNQDNPELIIDNLQPHSNLMELVIQNYKGERSPCWMEDSPLLNLSSLQLLHCPVWKGQRLSRPMPYLKILIINDCLNLDKLPDVPLSLIEFRVSNVGLTCLPNLYRSFGNNTPAPLPLKSSLRVVEIENCPFLISLDGFLQQGNLDLPAIERLTIKNCERLVGLPTQGFENLTSLKYLSLTNCPKLVAVDFQCNLLPEKLQIFYLGNCGELDVPFPDYNTSSDSIGGPSTPSLKSSLEEVTIWDCPNLTSLNGFLQQEYIGFQSIKRMNIIDCNSLVQLPIGAFGKFVSLTWLRIKNCPKLVAVDNQSNLLPMTLEYLSLHNCGELDVQLLESASRLTALTVLDIQNCANITHIPCSENAFRSLSWFTITGCDKLIEHSSREPAHGVNLQGSTLASLKIDNLDIDALSLLLIEPLRSLRFVSELDITNCSGMDVFPEQWLLQNRSTLSNLAISDASSLKALPATMATLAALKELHITNASLLEELPELPTSLRCLSIEGAGPLKSLPATMARLTALEELIIIGADSLEELPELPASLRILTIEDARSLKSLPATVASLTALKEVKISGADSLEELPELPASLRSLKIKDVWSLKSLPATVASLTTLSELKISGADSLEELPELPAFLRSLKIKDARSLKSLPATVASLTALQELRIYGANSMEELPELPASLRSFTIEDARSLKSLPATVASLTALKELTIYGADLLEELPELPPNLEVKSIYRSDGTELST